MRPSFAHRWSATLQTWKRFLISAAEMYFGVSDQPVACIP
jgi:hypothetical protein